MGLFSALCGDAKVTDLGLNGVDISSLEGWVFIGGTIGGYVGGIAGRSVNDRGVSTDPGNIEISRCFVTGKIESSNYKWTGGIIGSCDDFELTVQDCYNAADIGSVENGFYIGGIIGDGRASSSRSCYNAGTVKGLPEQSVGGIDGRDEKSDQALYYMNKSVSGGTESRCGTPLTEAQMKTEKAFTGLDFDNTWYMDAAGDYDYPQLSAEPGIWL